MKRRDLVSFLANKKIDIPFYFFIKIKMGNSTASNYASVVSNACTNLQSSTSATVDQETDLSNTFSMYNSTVYGDVDINTFMQSHQYAQQWGSVQNDQSVDNSVSQDVSQQAEAVTKGLALGNADSSNSTSSMSNINNAVTSSFEAVSNDIIDVDTSMTIYNSVIYGNVTDTTTNFADSSIKQTYQNSVTQSALNSATQSATQKAKATSGGMFGGLIVVLIALGIIIYFLFKPIAKLGQSRVISVCLVVGIMLIYVIIAKQAGWAPLFAPITYSTPDGRFCKPTEGTKKINNDVHYEKLVNNGPVLLSFSKTESTIESTEALKNLLTQIMQRGVFELPIRIPKSTNFKDISPYIPYTLTSSNFKADNGYTIFVPDKNTFLHYKDYIISNQSETGQPEDQQYFNFTVSLVPTEALENTEYQCVNNVPIEEDTSKTCLGTKDYQYYLNPAYLVEDIEAIIKSCVVFTNGDNYEKHGAIVLARSMATSLEYSTDSAYVNNALDIFTTFLAEINNYSTNIDDYSAAQQNVLDKGYALYSVTQNNYYIIHTKWVCNNKAYQMNYFMSTWWGKSIMILLFAGIIVALVFSPKKK